MPEQDLSCTIKFLGAAGTVTGSKTLLSVNGWRVLIDCGLFQGPKAIRLLNWQSCDIAQSIDAVVLTHAHIDHSGYLPKLVREGFAGPIYCSEPTADLCRIMLMDAAYLQEEDARYANKTKHSKHVPALPLYKAVDAERAIALLEPISDDTWHELTSNLSFQMLRSGHILGSRFVQFDVHGSYGRRLITFSGDVGHDRSLILKGPVRVPHTDVLVVESTYGDRVQPRADTCDQLQPVINRTYDRGGVLVIPAFSVGRTQELLFAIGKLKSEQRIPDLKVYLDSPMSLNATEIYTRHASELRPVFLKDRTLNPLWLADFEPIRSPDESMLLCMQDGPFIVISAAGMLTGGRILHHLKHRLPDPANAVLFCGYQALETKGRLLQDGIDTLRIHHQEVSVEAEIVSLESISAHADQTDLLQFVQGIDGIQQLFVNHGEPAAAECLAGLVNKQLDIRAIVPAPDEEFAIEC